MTDKTYVRRYKRVGKYVKPHLRQAKKKLDGSLSGRKDGIEVDTSNGHVGLELDGYIYEQIDKGIDKPVNILKKHGLTKQKLIEIIESKKFDEKGHIVVRNRKNGDTKKIKLFDFMYGNYGYSPQDVEPLSEELTK